MEIHHHTYPVNQLSNGDTLSIHATTFDSQQEGPHIYLQANVHGAELQGNMVIRYLMTYFQQNTFVGKITFVPFANPMGSTQTFGGYTYGRFNPRTGDNWNRNYLNLMALKPKQYSETLEQFVTRCQHKKPEEITQHFKSFIRKNLIHFADNNKSYGLSENKKLFIQLQIMASEADVVLDLHTGSLATRYLYAAEYEKEWAKKLHFPHTLIIPNEFAGAMDEACFTPWIELQKRLEKEGISYHIPTLAFTVELGSEEGVCSKEAHQDSLRILHLLKEKKFHQNKLEDINEKQYCCELKNFKSYYSPSGGLCEYFVSLGAHFKAGETLAVIHQFNSTTSAWEQSPVKAQKNGILINRCATGNIGEGHGLMQVMEEFSPF